MILPLLDADETRQEIAAVNLDLLRLGLAKPVSPDAAARVEERRRQLAYWRVRLEQQLAELEARQAAQPTLEEAIR